MTSFPAVVPLLKFGLISDTQYVDADDGATFDGSTVRRYRHSLEILRKAVDYFKSEALSFCVLLGDAIDAKAGHLGIAGHCLDIVLDLTSTTGCPWNIVLGNHDLKSISRPVLLEKFIPSVAKACCDSEKMYYDFIDEKSSNFRFIFLDGYDVSCISPSSEKYKSDAVSLLSTKNKNLSPTPTGEFSDGDWFAGLAEEELKFVPYNGSIGERQLAWFNATLKAAHDVGERCFVFCHEPCHKRSCRPSGLLWNSDEVLQIMHQYKSTVVAYICGHDHNGGYVLDECGIHHIVPPAPLECEVGDVAFGCISLYEEHFELTWAGKVPDPAVYPVWPAGRKIPYSV